MKQDLQRVIAKFGFFFFIFFIPFLSSSQPGTLDLSFGNSGKVTTAFDSLGDYGRKLVVTADGGSIMAGEVIIKRGSAFYGIGLAKHNATGKLDSSFGNIGKVATYLNFSKPTLSDLIVQPDGKIIAAVTDQLFTSYSVYLVRYLANGKIDSSFGTNGITPFNEAAEGFAKAMVLQPDGNIVVAGYSSGLTIGKLEVWRYKPNGSYDSSFGTNGVNVLPLSVSQAPMSMIIQQDNKFLIATTLNESMCVIRITQDGNLDPSYIGKYGVTQGYITVNPNQPGYNSAATGLVRQSDNKIVVGGTISYGPVANLGLARIDTAGAIDPSFGQAGFQYTALQNYSNGYAVVKQPDDKILLAGNTLSTLSDFVIARYNKDGILDSSFGTHGYTITDFNYSDDYTYSMQLQSNSKILLGGYTKPFTAPADFALARYNNDSFSVLLVILLSFSGLQLPTGTQITWKTTNETANTIFILQKSTDGVHFVPIYKTNNNGNHSSIQQYTFLDRNGVNSVSYYRIQQQNSNGLSQFSGILKMDSNSQSKVSISPNPVNSTLHINGLPNNTISQILIVGNSGKTIQKIMDVRTTSLSVDVSSLSSGIYYLYITANKKNTMIKFLKK